jgi:uncharacterized OB-fold protein
MIETEEKHYLPPELAQVIPDPLSKEFWENCKKRVLSVQRCTACKTLRHPPRIACPKCQSFDYEWATVSGKGTVFTYIIVHHALNPLLAKHVPYNVAVVALDDAPGCRLLSNVVDATPSEMRVGMPVEVTWEEINEEVVLPRFRKARA